MANTPLVPFQPSAQSGEVALTANLPGGGSLNFSGINPVTVTGAVVLVGLGWWLCDRYHGRN
jgi:hypothetical protein